MVARKYEYSQDTRPDGFSVTWVTPSDHKVTKQDKDRLINASLKVAAACEVAGASIQTGFTVKKGPKVYYEGDFMEIIAPPKCAHKKVLNLLKQNIPGDWVKVSAGYQYASYAKQLNPKEEKLSELLKEK